MSAKGNLALVRRMRAGDEQAFEEFFGAYYPPLSRFASSRIGRDAEAVADIVQVTLSRAVRKLHTYRGEATLLTWLCTLCRHEIGDHLKRHRRPGPTLQLVDDDPEVQAALESLGAMNGDPEELYRRAEITRRVWVALDALPGRYGHVLEWKYIYGLSVKEIAGRLGVGVKAAESVLWRAREAFRDAFATLSPAARDA